MSYLDRIREANSGHRANSLPFKVAGLELGRVREDLASQWLAFEQVFVLEENTLTLVPELDHPKADPAERSAAVGEAASTLHRQGTIKGWRDELYSVRQRFQDAPVLLLERAALPLLGIRGWGVHLNGYVDHGGERLMWIARRSSTKATWPGLLDQVVAGGQPADLDIATNVVKECQEEAGMSPQLAAQAIATGAISYCLDSPEGLRPGVGFTFDSALPTDFTPVNQDGEVEDFYLWPLDDVARRVREGSEFKFNCALVIIDFLVRHGYITAQEPDYLELITGLRAMPVSV